MRASFASLAVVTALASATPVVAKDRVLKPGKAAVVGMAPERLAAAAAILKDEIASGRIQGTSIFVARRGSIVLHETFGRRGPEQDSPPVAKDTPFNIASITKPFTVAALMRLVEDGQVCLGDPLQKYLPEFKGKDHEKVRVQDILSHVSGLPDMLPDNEEL